jgi:HD-GYP domain-containing protein (c-di-GMP phosphodiesterase class II)
MTMSAGEPGRVAEPEGSATVRREYLEELERAKLQLMVTARDMAGLYQRHKSQSERLQELMDELHQTYLSTVETLAFVVEAKDEYTRYHLERCRQYGMALTRHLDDSLITPQLEYGFLLHDVGKIGLPESILGKPGPLTSEEMRLVKTHPIYGVEIVTPLKRFLGEGVDVIRHHHERFDGDGYPDGLEGENIPLAARIFSVIDAFDAMTSDRPYRSALTFSEAMSRLNTGAGTQFDPEIVQAFTKMVDRLPQAAA